MLLREITACMGKKCLNINKPINQAIDKKCELRRAAEQLIHKASLRVAARAQKSTAAQSQRLFFKKPTGECDNVAKHN